MEQHEVATLQDLLQKPETEILIVGAGPTGLALAIALAGSGVKLRIIDRRPATNPHSRAIMVHARTLELYASLGLAERTIALGRRVDGLTAWVRGKVAGTADLGDFGAGLSPYPFMLSLSQNTHEHMLEAHLADLGISVERGCELADYADVGGGIVATLRRACGETEILRVSYLCGCDGFHSTTRELAGIGFPGGTYEDRFFVADVTADGPMVNGRLNVALAPSRFAAVIPLDEPMRCRIIGIVPGEMQDKDEPSAADIRSIAAGIPGLAVQTTYWSSFYRVHHRVAQRFRTGRVLLLGDAAHVHSPAGGQGMNTGIGDAFNLAWKLAAVVAGTARADLLETYESERRPFAESLLATTDRAFRYAVSQGVLARLWRLEMLPRLLPIACRVPFLRRQLFRTVSQTGVAYRTSALSDRSGRIVAAGDRMPWVGPGRGHQRAWDGRRWQIAVVGVTSSGIARFAADNSLPIAEILPKRARWTGLRRNAAYLVRPDGHIACVAFGQQAAQFERYRREHGLTWCRIATTGGQLAMSAKKRPARSVTPPAVAIAHPAKPPRG